MLSKLAVVAHQHPFTTERTSGSSSGGWLSNLYTALTGKLLPKIIPSNRTCVIAHNGDQV